MLRDLQNLYTSGEIILDQRTIEKVALYLDKKMIKKVVGQEDINSEMLQELEKAHQRSIRQHKV